MGIPSREAAFQLLQQYTDSDNLIKHGLAVEAAMRHFAALFGHDVEMWGVIGLVHDLDWDRYPEQHCFKTAEILRAEGWPEVYIRAIQSHGWGIVTDVKPEHQMEITLYTIDELTGLITATALVRPSKSLHDMTVKSVQKKWKEKSFAAGANREIIQQGAEMMGMPLNEVIQHTIAGMQSAAAALGLDGSGL